MTTFARILVLCLALCAPLAGATTPIWLLVQVIPPEQSAPPRVQIWPIIDEPSCKVMQSATFRAVPGSLAACQARTAVGPDNVTWVLSFATRSDTEQGFYVAQFETRERCEENVSLIQDQIREKGLQGAIFGCRGFRHG